MSGIAPIFMAGPRLKLVLDGKQIAHCMGMNVSVRKRAMHIHTCGEYGPVGVQTLSFDGVSGSFQIQLLNPYLTQKLNSASAIASIRPDSTTPSAATSNPCMAIDDDLRVDNSPKNASANIQAMFDPSKLLLTNTFEIEVWQLYPDGKGGITDVCQMTITKVRLDASSTNITLGNLTQQTFSFTGAYVKVFAPSLANKNVSKIVESDTQLDAKL
jgi:hypothetical protein